MLKLTQLLHKTLLDRSGEQRGQITAILWTGHNCLLQTETGIFAAKHTRAVKNVLADTATETPTQAVPLTVGMQIFNTEGKLLGVLCDVELTPSLLPKSLLCPEALAKKDVWAVGDAVLVRQSTRRPPRPKLAPPKATPQATQLLELPHRMNRKYGDFSFLVGKTLNKTIVNLQGEVMAKAGETVTRDVLRQAKVAGKLIELYLHVN